MDLRELKNVKLMKNEDIILPDNSKDKKVKLCLSPIYAIYLYDKDEDGQFIEFGGYAEKFMLNGDNFHGVLDKESKNGYKIVRGVAREFLDKGDEGLFLNVRDNISNTETIIHIGEDGDSVHFSQFFDGEYKIFSLIRDKDGNMFSGYGIDGVILIDEGKPKRFIYTFIDENTNPKPGLFPPSGNVIMYQTDYQLSQCYVLPGTSMSFLRVDGTKPYCYYTTDNEKFYYDPQTDESTFIEKGEKVRKLIEKVKIETKKELKKYGLDKYDKKTKTYIQDVQKGR